MDKLTIKQAAQALGVSAQTIRRRISKGELPATKEMTDFGEMWFIPASAVEASTHTLEVVPLTRSITPSEIGQIIDFAVAKQVEGLTEEIKGLRAELAAHLKRQEEKAVLEATTEHKGFWRRLFGG